MKTIISLVISGSLIASAASAEPAVTTAKINFRQGPGTQYKSLGQIGQGASVDLGQCDSNGA